MAPSTEDLPIRELEAPVRSQLGRGRIVISAPTGSGKSTLVPLWCAEEAGRVLVVEPRRVACRSLARFVAQLRQTELGDRVGYAVRHDERVAPRTELAYVTTGVALRMIEDGSLARYPAVILDEFHERSLEVDLLLALLAERRQHLIVMSATLDGARLAEFLGASWLQAAGRLHPVSVEYVGAPLLPSEHGLEERVCRGVEQLRDRPGDFLVFLPGKAEIARCQAALQRLPELEVLPLHAQLRPEEQDRVFEPGSRRRVILATNVAETAVTLPRIGLVLDSGLVRQTRYRGTRGYLTLGCIALDSAEQRRGRAGRLMPGHCLRLWSEAAVLEATTLPEIRREALQVAVLAAGSCGRRLWPPGEQPGPPGLRLLDPPRAYAIEAAERSLREMAALRPDGGLTPLGQRLAALPLDAFLGRILLEAERTDCLPDALDLVAGLAGGRPLFLSGPRPADPEDDLRAGGCDATARIHALRWGEPERHRLHGGALQEARATAEQLARLFRLSPFATRHRTLTRPARDALARTILAAHPHAAYVARRRKREVAWANGREELELGRDSGVNEAETEALVVLETQALTVRQRQTVQVITAAIPCQVALLRGAGLGEVRLTAARLERNRLVAEAVRSHAGLVLERTELCPTGDLARAAVVRLALEGRLFPEAVACSRERIAAHNLYRRLKEQPGPPGQLEEWLSGQVAASGLETGEDLALLLPEDFTHPDLPPAEREWLDRHFPRELSVGDARYAIEYDEQRLEATLVKVAGNRTVLPNPSYLPAWPGWRLLHRDRAVVRVLRERR